MGVKKPLQPHESSVIDLRNYKIVLRYWKICKSVTMVDLCTSSGIVGRLLRTHMMVVGKSLIS